MDFSVILPIADAEKQRKKNRKLIGKLLGKLFKK